MPQDQVRVDQGLVNAQDQSTLDKGELAKADDCFYKPSNPALHKAFGRVAFNSAALSAPVRSARALEFKDGSSIFVAYTGTDYEYAPAGLTGTFTPLGLGLSGSGLSLDATYSVRGDMYVMMNGVDRNRTITQGPTVAFHGMLQNINPPTVVQESILAGFTLTAGKAVSYWVEERVKDADGNIIKRNISAPARPIFGASPAAYPARAILLGLVNVTNPGAQKPRVYRPAVLNPDATHWALFGTSATGAFPVGGELGEVPIGTLFIDDPRTGTDPGISGTLYETVAVTLAGVAITSPKHGPAPVAWTGDVFEGALVLNDVANPLFVQYSFFDEPHAFPPLFTIVIPAKKADAVQVIRTLDNFCMVLCRDSVFRLNTLPQTDDSAFSVGRVLSNVEGAHGCVGPRAAAKFSFGEGPRLAYVSRYGVVVTDGHDWAILSSDFDWENGVELSQISKCVLTNFPRFYLLELRYPSKGSTRCDKKLFFHYHPSHAKTGSTAGEYRAKITGPINQDANEAFTALINGATELFDAHEDGRLYRCHTGNVEPVAQGGIRMDVLTAERYPGGVGGEATARTVYVHHQSAPGQTADVRIVQRRPNVADGEAVDTIKLDRRQASPVWVGATAESFQLGFANSDTLGSASLDYFTVVYDPPHKAESP